jgi:CYTH domain-containing protein
MVKKIAITGGPCSGKTTSKAYLLQKLSERGFYPFFVPEAATLLMEGNFFPTSEYSSLKDFQYGVAQISHYLETVIERAVSAGTHPKPIILTDRGIPEIEAYCADEAMYVQILNELRLGSKVGVRDRRYHAAFHLRTAASGAENSYTLENNPKRLEKTLEAARLADERTLRAWIGHPHLRVIDNSTDFDGKLARLDQQICSYLGIPVPLEIEKKYLCAPIDPRTIPVPIQEIFIEQFYLYSADPQKVLRVRKRGQFGSYVYFQTEKRGVSAGVRVETEHFISRDQYKTSRQFQLPDTRLVNKTRYCFVHDNQYFELDVIPFGFEDLYLLEIELTQETQQVKLPPFLKILEDVTDDPHYTNRAIANLSWRP